MGGAAFMLMAFHCKVEKDDWEKKSKYPVEAWTGPSQHQLLEAWFRALMSVGTMLM